MSTYEIAPDKERTPFPLTKTLFITWGCSILFGGGIFFTILAFIFAMVVGLLSFFGPPVWEASMIITAILGLATAFAGPILLERIITHNWRRGIQAGLGSILAGILAFLVAWAGLGVLSDWVSSWPGHPPLLERVELYLVLLISITSCAAIITLILLSKTHQYRTLELIAGLVIGIGLSMISGMMLGTVLLTDDDIFHLIWQIPPLVWISVVYFPELLAGQSKWTDFLVWAFLVLVSFGLPFVVVPLFPSISS